MGVPGGFRYWLAASLVVVGLLPMLAPGALGMLGGLLDDEGDGLDAGDLADAGKKFLGGFLGGGR